VADITLSGNANWSTCKSGGPPASIDNIYLNGYNLTLDGADAATYTCALIRACQSDGVTATSGTILLGAPTITCTIAANLRAGTVTLLIAATGKTVTVNGTVTGGTASSAYGIAAVTGTVIVTASVGGSYSTAYGLVCSNSGTATVGTATGGTAATGCYGAYVSGGTLTVTTAQGATATPGAGVYCYNGTLLVTNAIGGSVAGSNGVNTGGGVTTITTAKGGSVVGALGVLVGVPGSGSGLNIVNLNGTDLTGVGYPVGVYAGILKVAAGVKLYYQNASATLTKFYDPTLLPATTDVRNNTSFGGGDFVGSYQGSGYGRVIGG
jgi:hypothetical protein